VQAPRARYRTTSAQVFMNRLPPGLRVRAARTVLVPSHDLHEHVLQRARNGEISAMSRPLRPQHVHEAFRVSTSGTWTSRAPLLESTCAPMACILSSAAARRPPTAADSAASAG